MALNKLHTHTHARTHAHTHTHTTVLQAIIIAVDFCPSSIYRIYPKHSVASTPYIPFLKFEHVQFNEVVSKNAGLVENSVDAAETLDSSVSSGSTLFKQTSLSEYIR